METSLDQQWQQYFTLLDEAEKKSVLQMLQTLLKGRDKQPVAERREQLHDTYNNELAEGESAFQRGEYITHAELKKEMDSW